MRNRDIKFSFPNHLVSDLSYQVFTLHIEKKEVLLPGYIAALVANVRLMTQVLHNQGD